MCQVSESFTCSRKRGMEAITSIDWAQVVVLLISGGSQLTPVNTSLIDHYLPP